MQTRMNDERRMITFIADSLYDRDHTEAYAQTIWDNIRPDSPKSIEPA